MQTIKGTVTKIRLLTFTSSPLVRFTVGTTNCLINRHSLSFLADVTEGMLASGMRVSNLLSVNMLFGGKRKL